MRTALQNSIKQLIRSHFGACEMRFYEDSVTVTLVRDYGKLAMSELRVELDSLPITGLADEAMIHEMILGAEIVTENRFKLRMSTHQDYEPNLRETASTFRSDRKQGNLTDTDKRDLEDAARMISGAVDSAHEQDLLQTLLAKEIEHDMEDFILTNLGVAMVLLQKSNKNVSLDEVKELMRFSYLSGLWKNARERDLQVLADVFNAHFTKYAQNWSLHDLEGGTG